MVERWFHCLHCACCGKPLCQRSQNGAIPHVLACSPQIWPIGRAPSTLHQSHYRITIPYFLFLRLFGSLTSKHHRITLKHEGTISDWLNLIFVKSSSIIAQDLFVDYFLLYDSHSCGNEVRSRSCSGLQQMTLHGKIMGNRRKWWVS